MLVRPTVLLLTPLAGPRLLAVLTRRCLLPELLLAQPGPCGGGA
ncbi:hypothetical protein [Kibdelosporangium phytohabitans]|nr:hypothetical protein [Kibdelosporangium phytohabitans]MBE1471041.1 hypothetical protein [Kibdelosporangium phytohabitans]